MIHQSFIPSDMPISDSDLTRHVIGSFVKSLKHNNYNKSENTDSYRGDFSLMVLLPWRSDSGVRGLLLVTPDHEQTGWHHVKEHKNTHSHTHTHNRHKDKQIPQTLQKQKNTLLTPCDTPVLLSEMCLLIGNIIYCRWFNTETKIWEVNSELLLLVLNYGRWHWSVT